MTIYFIGSVDALRAYIIDHKLEVSANAVLAGRERAMRYLGLDPDRICNQRPEPGDTIILDEHSLQAVSHHQAYALRRETDMLRRRRRLT